jgi:hypothetical protein
MAGFFVEANKRFNLASSSRDLCPKLFHSKFLEKSPKTCRLNYQLRQWRALGHEISEGLATASARTAQQQT